MIRTRFLVLGALLAALLALAVQGGATAVAIPTPDPSAPALVLRVVAPSSAQVTVLSSRYDLLEAKTNGDYFVLGDRSTAKALKAQGYTVRTEKTLAPLPKATATTRSGLKADGSISAAAYGTFYGGYHTVDAQMQHLRDVAAAYPALTTLVDYGDSWRKT